MMRIKFQLFVAGGLSIGILVIFFLYNSPNTKESSSQHTILVYKVTNGYGYQIKNHNKVLIQQNQIPVIQKNAAFKSYNDAKKTALLVLSKVTKKQAPTISKNELKNLELDY